MRTRRSLAAWARRPARRPVRPRANLNAAMREVAAVSEAAALRRLESRRASQRSLCRVLLLTHLVHSTVLALVSVPLKTMALPSSTAPTRLVY